MAKQRKFSEGKIIRNMGDLAKVLKAGRYVMLFGVPKHHGWITSMQYRTVASFVARKAFRVAVRNPQRNGIDAQSSSAVERHNPHEKNRK